MLSYWEQESFTKYDIAIIGAGITGLSTAIELKEKEPKLNIVVLERGLIPTGASTKNAGFACVGSLTEILDDLAEMSVSEVVELVKFRKEGLELLRNRLGDQNIGYKEDGSYELCFDDRNYDKDIEKVNGYLFPVFEKNVFKISDKKFGFNTAVKTIIESSAEGQIHTGMMMKNLLMTAGKLGVEIKTGFQVESIKAVSQHVKITSELLTITVRQVCVCSNAFAKSLLPSIKMKPGRGQVLITNPIKDLPFKGSFHFMEGYYYFRTINDRVLFGGGRQIDFDTETSTEFELNHKILSDLELKLREIILPNTSFKVDRQWTGIMVFGENKKPIIKEVTENVFAAVRFGGMGVAIGSKAAEMIAELMLTKLNYSHK